MPIEPDPDTVRLRTALRDLVALSAVPAAWLGREPSAIAAGLADVLVGSLYLDFAFVRLCDPKGGVAVEATRGDAWKSFPEWLQRYLAVKHSSYKQVIPDVGGRVAPCRGLVIPIGVGAEGGLVAAASGRPNFPDEIDQLLLSVAANQGATTCQSARLLHERSRADEALRESEQRWQSLAEALPQLVWAATPDGAYDYFSIQWTQYTGIPERELLGWRWLEVVHPDDREATRQCWRHAAAGRRPYDVEHRIRRRDGVFGWFKTRGVPIRGGGGNIVKWFGSCTDISELKRLESERHTFVSLVENSTEFVGMCDLSMKALFVNDAGRRLVGLDSLQQALEMDVKDYFFPEDREFVFEQFLPHALREGRGEVEIRFRHFKTGAPIWMLYNVWPLTDPDGRHVGFATVSRDISERKRESEERFRTLAQFSFDEYWESDAQHRFIRLEFAADAPPLGSELGKTRWEVPYLEPDAEAWRKHRQTLDTHLPFRDFELARPTPDGDKRYVSVSGLPVFDKTGRFIGYRGVGQHITGRKRAEEALRYHMQLLKTVTDSASSALYIVDPAGVGTFVNPSLERMTGFRAGELIGQVVHDMIHHTKPDGSPYPVHECPLMGSVLPGRVLHGEEFFVRKDGTFFPVYYTISPIFRDGAAAGALIEVQDLTESKQAEQALHQARADLAHVSRVTTMGELTASLAHEIKQPIAAAATNAQACLRWLARDRPDLKEAREAASRLVKDTTRASDIIDRIRLLFKKGAPQRELVDANEIIREMTVLLRQEAARYAISIRAELASGLPQILADRVLLQQVLMNLMLNGIEAMKDMNPAGELTIKSQQDEHHLLISVSDTGVGLPPEQADQIFKAFFTTKPQGTGMGLPISQSIIESHGGRLWSAANAGRGTTFHLTLPRKVEISQPGQDDAAARTTTHQNRSTDGPEAPAPTRLPVGDATR